MARNATKTKPNPEATLLKVVEAPALPAVQQPGGAVATATSDPIFTIIERLAKDPSFDVDKMERLINMHERAKAGNARTEYDDAMSHAQEEMKRIKVDKDNSQTKSKYASYGALDRAIRPIYAKNGFALSFNTADTAAADMVRVLCTVSHRGGHREEYKLDMPTDGKGPQGAAVMTKTHATGSAITYAKRYLAGMVFNLAIGNDDDGNAAGDRAKNWTDAAIQELNALEKDKVAFAKWTTDNEKSVNWLKKNAPEEFARYQIAYQNAAERAGIKNEEPKRAPKKNEKASAGDPPHSDQQGDGQPGAKAVKEAAPPGPPDPKVTDVVDQNAPLEFGEFKTAKEFLDFSSGWIAEPGRTAADAKQWHDQFKDKINQYLQHEFKGTTKSWIKESMTDTFAAYVKITADQQPG